MRAHECFHCKQWIEEGQEHDCWTTTEAALTKDLSEDLREAWERVRETVVEFGDQRVYASHHSIMFSRKSCYFFVRPGTKYLELCIFLGRSIKSAKIRTIVRSSKTKLAHLLRVVHRDEVESPITDWLKEAYDYGATVAITPRRPRRATASSRRPARRRRAAARRARR